MTLQVNQKNNEWVKHLDLFLTVDDVAKQRMQKPIDPLLIALKDCPEPMKWLLKRTCQQLSLGERN
jgi:hypothetical protein